MTRDTRRNPPSHPSREEDDNTRSEACNQSQGSDNSNEGDVYVLPNGQTTEDLYLALSYILQADTANSNFAGGSLNVLEAFDVIKANNPVVPAIWGGSLDIQTAFYSLDEFSQFYPYESWQELEDILLHYIESLNNHTQDSPRATSSDPS